MKFKNKLKQEILEVLTYQDGPKVYGFFQNKTNYLALLMDETFSSSKWLVCPLNMTDKDQYEKVKTQEISLINFLENRIGYVVEFEPAGKQLSEQMINCLSKDSIPSYEINQ